MSHKSGEHGLTIHDSIEQVRAEVQSVVVIIKENNGDSREAQEAFNDDMHIIDYITGDGTFNELSDTTWFDVFEREIVLPTIIS